MNLYFDYNGSTPIHPQVAEVYYQSLTKYFGNTAASHPEGQKSLEAMEGAADVIARAIGAARDSLWFSSGGTEANNWAMIGAAEANPDKRHLIVTSIEHKSVLNTARYLAKRGRRVTWLDPEPNGAVTAQAVKDAIEEDTLLVSVMHANNETGVFQPVEDIGVVCREAGVLFHCDTVATLGKTAIDVNELGCDMLTFSSHKMYAPKGCGALYLKPGLVIKPLIHGCGTQRGMRGGTVNMSSIIAFAKAFELLAAGELMHPEQTGALRDRLFAELEAKIPGLERNGSGPFIANTLSVYFPGQKGVELMRTLGERGISVSAGSAATDSPSHVLRAMGFPDVRAGGSLRISLGLYTDDDQIDQLVDTLVSLTAAQVS